MFQRFFARSRLALSVGSLAWLVLASCGKDDDGSQLSPCESELECGEACSATDPCEGGQFCDDGTCTAECVVGDSRCGSNEHCENGRCVPGVVLGSGGSSSSGGSTGAGGDDGCIQENVIPSQQVPTVVLLVDQSSSMDAQFGNGDRWSVLRDSLMDRRDGVVASLESQIRFGLTLYSSANGAAPCPSLTTVAPSLDNYDAIDSAYPENELIEDTPTGESIDAVVASLANFDEPGQKVIVLATDGEPDTCARPDPNDEPAREVSVVAAENAFAAGVITYVISVGDEVGRDHLRVMANVGQGYPRDDRTDRFFRVNDQNELAAAFESIITGVLSCVVTLNGNVKEDGASDGLVRLNGQTLEFEGPDGWRLTSPSQIELLGQACEDFKTGQQSLSIEFPCGEFEPGTPE